MSDSKRALDILSKYKDVVWPEVEKYINFVPQFPKQFGVPKEFESFLEFHLNLVADYPQRRGKYLRPTVLILTALALSAKIEESIKTATAMQISEDWLLIHDDFEDNSEERRGKPALHKIYGQELAVNAGDALHMLMWRVLIDNFKVLSNEKALKVLVEFEKMLTRTAIGQTTEIKKTKDLEIEVGDDAYMFIIDGKTSYYSVAGPIRLGAIIAGADDKQIDVLTDFGKNLGRAFQIVDDILDVTSDFNGLKQKGNDIYEGKRTLMLNHLAKDIKGKDKEKLLKIMKADRSGKTQDDVNWVINQMEKYGSIVYARKVAKEFKDEALEILDTKLQFMKKPYIDELRILTEFILERDH